MPAGQGWRARNTRDSAVRQFRHLVAISTGEHGPNDSATLTVRRCLAYGTREAGDPTTAIHMLIQLISDAKSDQTPNPQVIAGYLADLEGWLQPRPQS